MHGSSGDSSGRAMSYVLVEQATKRELEDAQYSDSHSCNIFV